MAPRRDGDVDATPGAGGGQRVEHAIVRGESQRLAAVPAVRHAVAVADHRALGKRRRPRRVEEREHVVGIDRARRQRLARAQDVEQAVAAGVRILGVDDHVAQVRQRAARQLAGDRARQLGDHLGKHLEVVDGAEVIRQQQRGRP